MGNQDYLVVGSVVLLGAASFWWQHSRSASLLQKWAEDNDLYIVSSEFRYLFRGPFFWTSRGRTVYRVTVEDKTGRVRKGWVLCGGWWWGLMSDHVEARWDKAPTNADAKMRGRWLDE